MLFPTCGIFSYFNFQLLGQWPKILNGLFPRGFYNAVAEIWSARHKRHNHAENALYQTTFISLQNAV